MAAPFLKSPCFSNLLREVLQFFNTLLLAWTLEDGEAAGAVAGVSGENEMKPGSLVYRERLLTGLQSVGDRSHPKPRRPHSHCCALLPVPKGSCNILVLFCVPLPEPADGSRADQRSSFPFSDQN